MKRFVSLFLMCWIIISISLLIISISPSTKAQSALPTPGIPTVNIALLDSCKTAHVSPDDDCSVRFNGTVSVDMNPLSRVEVSLSAEDTWGAGKVSPSNFVFTQSGEQSFVANTTARPRESTKNVGTITVTGRWVLQTSGLSGTANPQQGAVGRVEIAQFCSFTMKSPKTFTETSLNEKEVLVLTIQNRGNGNDIFAIEIDNSEELSDKDFEVLLSRAQVEIPENPAEENVRISVKVPSNVHAIGEHEIIVKVKSNLQEFQNEPAQYFTFGIRIPEENIFISSEFMISLPIIVCVAIVCIILIWRRRKKKRLKIKNNSV